MFRSKQNDGNNNPLSEMFIRYYWLQIGLIALSIIIELWGDEESESDALRSHIYNLRKMVDKPFQQKLIPTEKLCPLA